MTNYLETNVNVFEVAAVCKQTLAVLKRFRFLSDQRSTSEN